MGRMVAPMVTAAARPFTPTAPCADRTISSVSPRDSQVAIGPALPDDLGALFLWLNDAQAALSEMPYRPIDCITYKDWLDKLGGGQILFMIRTLAPPRAVGFVLFKNIQPIYRAAEIGIRIGAEGDRGKGYGARALALTLDHAWNVLNLHRVSLTVLAGNTRAIASYRRAGFREEGVMRDAAYVGGKWHDVLLMAAIGPNP